MGSVNLDNTGSGSEITLSSDGTSLLLDGTAVGGSPDLYAENYDGTSSKPSATGTNAVAIGISNASGSNAVALATSDNTTTYGAAGSRSLAFGFRAKASSSNAISLGSLSQASNTNAVSIGAYSIASGYQSSVFGTYGTASGLRSLVLSNSSVLNGTEATLHYAVALGNNAKSDIAGKFAFSNGRFSVNGDSQTGTFVLRVPTTDATATILKTNLNTTEADNQVILPNNSAYAFHGTIVARQSAAQGTASAAWKVEGLIRREGSAGTTVLVNSATTVLDNTPAWGMALTADTTNGGLAVTVTGAASTNIRWVATVNTSEVTYA